MKITQITYYLSLTFVFCLIGFALNYYFLHFDVRYFSVGIGLMLLEMWLIYYLIGIKKLIAIRDSNILFYLLLNFLISVFISINVFWFIESIFSFPISRLGYDIVIPYCIFSGLNFFLLNAILNYIIMNYEKNQIFLENSELNQSLQLKKEAELFKLRQQVDPHFLFNSLNSIHSLMLLDTEKANKMIYSLSQYFRNSIQKQDQHFIPLQDELVDIRLYLSIEMVRFGHRLHVIEDIDDESLNTKIPPLILQPLIENAIKYGLYGTSADVTIRMDIKRKILSDSSEYVQCTISNPYDENTRIKSGTGFGIAGIMRRLYLTYSRNDLIQISKVKENNTTIFKVILNIPYQS